MDPTTLIFGGAAAAGLALFGFVGRKPLQRWLGNREFRQALRKFRIEREVLEAKFFDMASVSGKPKGLRWLDCEWQRDVTFGRDRQTRLLTAFVAVNIRFEAIERGDMEDVAAVGTVREASALFHYHAGHWGTGGRPLFNMNPRDALVRLENQFEPLCAGEGGRRVEGERAGGGEGG